MLHEDSSLDDLRLMPLQELSGKEKRTPRKTQNKAVGTLTTSSMKGKGAVIRDAGAIGNSPSDSL